MNKHERLHNWSLLAKLFFFKESAFEDIEGIDLQHATRFFAVGVIPAILIGLVVSFFRVASDVAFVERFFWTALNAAGLFMVKAFFLVLLIVLVFSAIVAVITSLLASRNVVHEVIYGWLLYTPLVMLALSVALLSAFVFKTPLVTQIVTVLALGWSLVLIVKTLIATTRASHGHVEVGVFLGAILTVIVLVLGYVLVR